LQPAEYDFEWWQNHLYHISIMQSRGQTNDDQTTDTHYRQHIFDPERKTSQRFCALQCCVKQKWSAIRFNHGWSYQNFW
jgi:hypothetical protein